MERFSRTSECDGREREEMLKEDLEKNVPSQQLLQKQRETNVDPLSCYKQRVEEQKEGLEDCLQQLQNSNRRVARP